MGSQSMDKKGSKDISIASFLAKNVNLALDNRPFYLLQFEKVKEAFQRKDGESKRLYENSDSSVKLSYSLASKMYVNDFQPKPSSKSSAGFMATAGGAAATTTISSSSKLSES